MVLILSLVLLVSSVLLINRTITASRLEYALEERNYDLALVREELEERVQEKDAALTTSDMWCSRVTDLETKLKISEDNKTFLIGVLENNSIEVSEVGAAISAWPAKKKPTKKKSKKRA